MGRGRDFFPFLKSVDWNLLATKFEGQMFLKGGKKRAGDGGIVKKLSNSTLHQTYFKFAL